jgi:hypothetical protein
MPITAPIIPELTDETRAELASKLPGVDLQIVRAQKTSFVGVIRPATDGEWSIFRRTQVEDKVKANFMLSESCVVWPYKADRDAIFARYPALREVCVGEICEMAGVEATATREKL